jgi:Co/Zn/Cd efflux system component
LTLTMMIIEITAGYIFGSMALLADRPRHHRFCLLLCAKTFG